MSFDEDTVGSLPRTVILAVNANQTPTEMPPRRVPIAIRDKLKDEIGDLVVKGILRPVEEPSSCMGQ